MYNRVSVSLTTHDVEGVSPLDIEMAQAMDTFEKEVAQQEGDKA